MATVIILDKLSLEQKNIWESWVTPQRSIQQAYSGYEVVQDKLYAQKSYRVMVPL